MRDAAHSDSIAANFLAACHAELQALKPGNVHVHAPGHRMSVETFERAARAAAPHIASRPASVGRRILDATRASFAAVSVNANLGIVLLCVPLAKAAQDTTFGTGLRRQLAQLLAALDENDADDAFAAIRLANPAGLGKVEKGDVSNANARMTLTQAMYLAAERDRIANAYVTAFSDMFDIGLPALAEAAALAERPDLAVTTLHMTLLAAFPDSHIVRKWGMKTAEDVRERACELTRLWQPVTQPKSFEKLMEFDRALKAREINPGTTADFVVATVFAQKLSAARAS